MYSYTTLRFSQKQFSYINFLTSGQDLEFYSVLGLKYKTFNLLRINSFEDCLTCENLLKLDASLIVESALRACEKWMIEEWSIKVDVNLLKSSLVHSLAMSLWPKVWALGKGKVERIKNQDRLLLCPFHRLSARKSTKREFMDRGGNRGYVRRAFLQECRGLRRSIYSFISIINRSALHQYLH